MGQRKQDSCYYCKEEFGMNECRYIVRKAVKPTHTPYRFEKIGKCCEGCFDSGAKLTFDKWRD